MKKKNFANVIKGGLTILISVLIIYGMGSFIYITLAAPPDSPYTPGETLAPTCSPGDTNCTITPPAVSGTNSDITSMTALTSITRATGGSFNINIGSAAGDDFIIGTDKLVVEGDTGNVGIGMINPDYSLDIAGDINLNTTSNILRIGGTPFLSAVGTQVTLVGENAGASNSGSYVVAVGDRAGQSNQGNYNTFVGSEAGPFTIKSVNTFVGHQAGYSNITGSENTFVGAGAGKWNINGRTNVFVGSNAGGENIAGSYNSFFGDDAGRHNSTGCYNVAMGYRAGDKNTTGSNNVAVGVTALRYTRPTSKAITAFADAGEGVVTVTSASHGLSNGTSVTISGTTHYNGTYTISGVTTDTFNITHSWDGDDATGWWGIDSEGSRNTALGSRAGYSNVTGSGNVFLGYEAGYYEKGSNKLFIDNQRRADEADARAKALIYGVFDADPANQSLTVNGALITAGSITGNPIVTTVGAGIPDAGFANGALGIDSTNGRFYFKYNDAWHYVAQTAGFEIPNFETTDPISGEEIKEGDFVLGRIDSTISDGALHGVWVKWENVKKELIQELLAELDETGSIITTAPESIEKTIETGIFGSFINKVKQALASLGLFIENGVAQIKEVVTDKLTAKTAEVEVTNVQKFQMTDQVTGDIYCIWIENGEWVKVRASCNNLTNPNGQNNLARASDVDGGDTKEDVTGNDTSEGGNARNATGDNMGGDDIGDDNDGKNTEGDDDASEDNREDNTGEKEEKREESQQPEEPQESQEPEELQQS